MLGNVQPLMTGVAEGLPVQKHAANEEHSDHPLVSVVTPVYNGAAYLAECIESVLAQTFSNWEYVILDNVSTDETPEIARRYAEQDSRIRVIRPDTFLGQTANSNRILRQISPQSKYCKVLHADDWLFPECLERMVSLAERFPEVGIVSAYRLEETRVTLDGLPPSIEVLSGVDVARSRLLGEPPYPFMFGSPSSLLIRSDLIRKRDPFYNEQNPWDEDVEACFDVLQESDFGFVHQVLTFTRRWDGSPFSAYVRLRHHPPGRIKHLLRYGPAFLSTPEYQRRLATLLVRYALFFLSNPLRFFDREFRGHHGNQIRSLAGEIKASDVLVGGAMQARRMWAERRHRTK